MQHDDDIIDFDEEFRNLSEDDIALMIEDEWKEHQAERLNPEGLTSKIIEEYQEWYDGDSSRTEFLYRKVIELNKIAKGYESEEQRHAFIETLNQTLNGEVLAFEQFRESVQQMERNQSEPQLDVITVVKHLGRPELLTFSDIIQQLEGNNPARIKTRGLANLIRSRSSLFNSIRKLEDAGLLNTRRVNGNEILVLVKNEQQVKDAMPEIKRLTSS